MAKRFLIGGLLVVAMAATATASSLLLALGDIAAKLRCPERTECGKIAQDLEPVYAGKPQTIMLLGSDHRADIADRNMPERSDTVILVRLDPSKDAVGLVSLPRDLKVEIPGHGTDKLNAAYSIGGTRLTLKVVKQLLDIPVNHVVNVNFRGFKQAVNAIGCVYVDVDRRYYHSNLGLAPSQMYAEINVPPGYQKLCGSQALDYVRYRHTDSDLVRSARQQDFLRQARRQVTLSRLINNEKRLIDIFADNTTSDIRKTSSLLSLLRLTLASARKPIHQIHWRGEEGPSYVISTPEQVEAAVRQFMGVEASTGTAKLPRAPTKARAHRRKRGGAKRGPGGAKPAKHGRKRARKKAASPPAGLEVATVAGEQQIAPATGQVPFPIAYPRLREAGSQYDGKVRFYPLRGTNQHRFHAVKLVLRSAKGEYYGVMETDWLDAPILKDPSESRRMGGRSLDLYYDGDRLRLVAWRTRDAVYWVSNTLLQSLSEQEMLRIAASLRLA